MDQIQGQIGQIRFHKTNEFSPSGNKFIISRFTYNNNNKFEDVSIKGEMNSPVYGWQYKLYGQWLPDDPKYGRTFAFESFEPLISKSHEGMADYLARSVPQIGKVYARRIVDHFGEESFSILKTDPSRLSEVPDISRIAREQAEEFFSSDNALEIDPVAYSRLFDLLSPIRPPRRVIKSLLLNFGSNAPQFITDNPYRLLDYPGMGWDRVDQFAVKSLGYDPKGIERHKKAINEVIARESNNGHTKIDEATLHVESSNLLKTTLIPEAIESLKDEGSVIIEDDYISSLALYNAEQSIARELERIQSSDEVNWGFNISEDGFDEEQKQIPLMVKTNAVSIITGVPGSGKSHSVAEIVKCLYRNGIKDILICAPTGKAAKRNDEFLQESLPGIKIPCSTIHRALGGRMGGESEEGVPKEESKINRGREQFYFEYGKDNKLPFEYFIIDETSMADVSIFASFLEAIPDGARLLIVGDRHQLPSVGPGSVLRDLLEAGIPSVVLDKPRRNSGVIAQSCYQIKEGRCPIPSKEESNWTHVEKQKDEDILNIIIEIHKRYIAQNGLEAAKTDLQVISPEKKELLGCHYLNRMLGSIMNPDAPPFPEIKGKDKWAEASVRVNDKCMRIKNGFVKELSKSFHSPEIGEDGDYEPPKTTIFEGEEYYINECYVVNGDDGEVIGFKGSDIIVKFYNPDRLCLLPKAEAHVSLAYARTVHKCQGSGFQIVIAPFTDFYWNEKTGTGLLCRELLYTWWSRPIKRFISVGRLSEARKAVSRVTIHQRQTRLAGIILKRNQNADIQELRCI